MSDAPLQQLFSPFSLAGMELANRIVMAPMTRSFCGAAGVPNQAMVNYYAARAAGGCGLIITEGTVINMDDARGYNGIPAICNHEQQEGWQRVTEAVHQTGGKIAIQLWHTGRLGHSRAMNDSGPVAPSAVAAKGLFRDFGDQQTLAEEIRYETPRAMSGEDITRTLAQFAAATRRAKAAGFDAIELHGANGYLIHTFFNPTSNLRTDGYGGDVADRSRFAVEVIRAVCSEAGDLPVGIRLSQHSVDDYNWSTWADQTELATTVKLLKTAGADFLHASAYRLESPAMPDGEPLCAALSRLSGLPTIGCGGIGYSNTTAESFAGEESAANSPEPAALAIQNGWCDLVSVGRAMIANADWANRVRDGDWQSVKPFSASMLATLQ